MTKKKKTGLKAVRTLGRKELTEKMLSMAGNPEDFLYASLRAYSRMREDTEVCAPRDGRDATHVGDLAFMEIFKKYEFWSQQGLLGMTRATIRFMDFYVIDQNVRK
jgi:hypothetical protein